MKDTTSTELLSPQPEITEKSEDTPKSVTERRRIPMALVWALASTQITHPSSLDFSDRLFTSKNTTTVETESFEEFRSSFPVDEYFPEQESGGSEAETSNRVRLELLARQYVAGQLSTEEEARLVIVSERVRRLIPRVIVEDFQALEQILEDAERIGVADIERRRRLGIN